MSIQNHPCNIKVEDDAILWRYLSYSKFESLLKEQALFFCRADKFPDPYECSIPRRELIYRSSEKKHKFEQEMFGLNTRKFNPAVASDNSKAIANTHKAVKTATTVNCWHINNNESNAMWQLYLKNNEGVAIRTNVNRLYNTLQNTTEEIGISKVRYIDYENDIWYNEEEYPIPEYNYYTPLIHKKIEFRHESELRLYHHDYNREVDNFWENQPNSIGEFIKINIPELIESIVFHPTADDATKKKIIALTQAYSFCFEFEVSRLSIEPYF